MRHLTALFVLFLTVNSQVNAQTLFINEIIANNDTGVMDDFFEREDWIEIYNTGGIVNLAGYYLSDDPLDLTKWQIPSTDPTVTFVLPNSHIIFWADRDPEQGANHATFSLSADGESVFLVGLDGVTIIDQITFPPMASDISYGRSCDGCPEWQFFNNVTFEAPNGEIVPEPQLLFINEVQAENTSYEDIWNQEYDPWIEIYNPNTFQINLAGYYLGTPENPMLWQVAQGDPSSTVIGPGGFMLIWCDNQSIQGSMHSSLALEAGGMTVRLTALDGTTVTDNYTYAAVSAGSSYGRQSDGAPSSIVFNQPTPRVTNSLIFITPQPLFINEVLSANQTDSLDNYLEHEDWIEIYNPNSFPVNLTGYYITDNPDFPTKWMVPNSFPDSVTVDPFSWLLFWADENQSQGVRHTNFRLSNNGEYVGLYSPDGFSRADQILWDYIAPDTSLGRAQDGAPEWVLFTGTTPDASNNNGVVSVENMTEQVELLVYPNPTSDFIRFSRMASVKVYALNGQLIQEASKVHQLDMASWPAGCYLLREKEGAVFRIIKH